MPVLARLLGFTVIAVIYLSPPAGAAAPKELSLRWSELQPAVTGGKVKIVLPNGPRIEGKVIAVERINFASTSGRLQTRRFSPRVKLPFADPRYRSYRS